jgi:endoglucanase
VTPKLALNLGVRWEYGPPLTIAHNIYIRFEPATGHMLVAAVNASPSEHQYVVKNHVFARIGLAYSVDQKTVIRAAFAYAEHRDDLHDARALVAATNPAVQDSTSPSDESIIGLRLWVGGLSLSQLCCFGLSRSSRAVAGVLMLMMALAASAQYVHTRGAEILDGKDRPLNLKGTNLGNWLVPEGYMWHFDDGPASPKEIEGFVTELIGPTRAEAFWHSYRQNYITQQDIHFIRAQGFNMIRVPLHWKLFQTDDAEGFQLLDRLIGWCRSEGLYVMLDLHAAEGGQTGYNIDDGHGYPWLLIDAGEQQKTIDLWARIARRYSRERIVLGYDLLNEPIPNWVGYERFHPLLEPLYKRIATAIRKVDTHHALVLGGAEWDGDFSVFGPPFDSNVIYQIHKYWMGVNQSALQPFLDFRAKYNVPVWLGESGENSDEWVARFRGLLESDDIGWAFWPYKKMRATSSPVSFNAPKGWDQIVAYAKLAHSGGDAGSKERIKARPPQELIDAAMEELLGNIEFAHCTINAGYIHALLPGVSPDSASGKS